MQLLKVMDMWTESLESGGQIDLEKAFDKVPHKRLISKLYSYKINPKVIKWIEAFLTNRRQRVRINGFFLMEGSFKWNTTGINFRSSIVYI